MKKKPTPNKAEKYQEELYFKQQDHKDKEKRELRSKLYDNRTLPKRQNRGKRGHR